MSIHYRSPITGKGVSAKQYIKEWKSFIEPLENKYGLVVISYDSGIRAGRVINRGSPNFYSETVDLPLWFVKQLLE